MINHKLKLDDICGIKLTHTKKCNDFFKTIYRKHNWNKDIKGKVRK